MQGIAIPSDWHRCPNPNCNERFRSKKRVMDLLSSVRIRTSAGSRTQVRWYAIRRSNHSATQLVPLNRQNDVFKLNV